MIHLWDIDVKIKHVVVKEYDSAWKSAFLEIQAYLYQEVPSKFLIEHVGSTSIEGLSAKPIIDIDIVYEDDSDKEFLIHKLSKLGYIHEGDLGIVEREAFTYDDLPFMKHHLYVIKGDSIAYQDHIYLKKYLSVHEKEKKQYGDLKLLLAKRFPNDIDRYYEGKSPFIQDILKKASLWMMENTS